MFYLKSDVAIEQEFSEDPGWWAKHGTTVVSITVLITCAAIGLAMIIFGFEAYKELISGSAPPWLNTLVDAINGGQAPPAQ